jgi:hypothetical protein
VSVHDIWTPIVEFCEQRGDVVVARRYKSHRVIFGEPGQIDIGPNDSHAGNNLVFNKSRCCQSENAYVVAIFGQRL